jgi:hypothetical protein
MISFFAFGVSVTLPSISDVQKAATGSRNGVEGVATMGSLLSFGIGLFGGWRFFGLLH